MRPKTESGGRPGGLHVCTRDIERVLLLTSRPEGNKAGRGAHFPKIFQQLWQKSPSTILLL